MGWRPENGASSLRLHRILGLSSYERSCNWFYKLRRAMFRLGLGHLSGQIEVDETCIGGEKGGNLLLSRVA